MIIKNLSVAALALSFFSCAYAGTETSGSISQQEKNYVSVTGAVSVEDAVTKLEKKAQESGASHMQITSIGGKNKLYGSALIKK